MACVIEGFEIKNRGEQLQFAADIAEELNNATQIYEFGQALVNSLDPVITQQIRTIDCDPQRARGPVLLTSPWGIMISNALLDFSDRNAGDATDALDIWAEGLTMFARAEINASVKSLVIGGMKYVFNGEPYSGNDANGMRAYIAEQANGIASDIGITPHNDPAKIVLL